LSELDRFYLPTADGAVGADGGAGADGAVCGTPEGPCCANQACQAGAICQASVCKACGAIGEPCCAGSTCGADWLECNQGNCRSCVTELSLGGTQACIAKTDGTVWCWGGNEFGELGIGRTAGEQSTPQEVTTLMNVREVAAGTDFGCAATQDDSIWCWGSGQWGLPAMGLPSGNVVKVQTLRGATELGASQKHGCALQNGEAVCWGTDNAEGQLGAGAAPGPHGTYFPVPAFDLSVGGAHNCARLTDGTVECWGDNRYGQLGTGSISPGGPTPVPVELGIGNLSNIGEVSAGLIHTCAVTRDHVAYCWGWNMFGQVGIDTMDRPFPAMILTGVETITAGFNHTCAVKTDGTVWCWGANTFGQIGQDTISYQQSSIPLQVAGLDGVASVRLGGPGVTSPDAFSCAQKKDGSIWCWGSNGGGQLGNGMTSQLPQPTPVQAQIRCR
jgi:alpha-tubulin suppressor-like RCC1 family protein